MTTLTISKPVNGNIDSFDIVQLSECEINNGAIELHQVASVSNGVYEFVEDVLPALKWKSGDHNAVLTYDPVFKEYSFGTRYDAVLKPRMKYRTLKTQESAIKAVQNWEKKHLA